MATRQSGVLAASSMMMEAMLPLVGLAGYLSARSPTFNAVQVIDGLIMHSLGYGTAVKPMYRVCHLFRHRMENLNQMYGDTQTKADPGDIRKDLLG